MPDPTTYRLNWHYRRLLHPRRPHRRWIRHYRLSKRSINRHIPRGWIYRSHRRHWRNRRRRHRRHRRNRWRRRRHRRNRWRHHRQHRRNRRRRYRRHRWNWRRRYRRHRWNWLNWRSWLNRGLRGRFIKIRVKRVEVAAVKMLCCYTQAFTETGGMQQISM